MEHITEWADAVSLFCAIPPDDYKQYIARKTMNIENRDMQDAVVEYSPVFGHLLEWIQRGIALHNANSRVPEECVLNEIDLGGYRSAWMKHINGERQSLTELKTMIDEIVSDIRRRKSELDAENSDGYSSYSDYSEEDTESEDDEENDPDEDDENDGLKRLHHRLPTPPKTVPLNKDESKRRKPRRN